MSSSIKTEKPGAAFTPGPWEVFFPTDDPDAGAVRPGIDAVDGPTLILWGTDEDGEGVYGETPEQAKANAYLIAAAPDLLAALKDVLRIARAASIGITGNAKRIAAAEAAITKAESSS
jgi:hypothetical protein